MNMVGDGRRGEEGGKRKGDDVLLTLLDCYGINLIVAEDALARICLLSSLVRSLDDGRIVYIDLDTVFTAYVMHGIMGIKEGGVSNGAKIDIMMPDIGRVEDLLATACSEIDVDTRLVVLDSIHGFYHLYDRVKVTSLNQLLTSYITLLAMHAERYSIPFLVTSIMKKRIVEGVGTTQAYSSRYLWSKSSTIISARYSSRDYMLMVRVVKHRSDMLKDTIHALKVVDYL